jgi:AraC-like DNA-binding protein
LILRDFIPSGHVKDFVQVYRIVHLVFDKNQTVPFKAYPPRPEHCLAFYPFDREKVQYVSNGKVVENLPIVFYGQQTEVTHRYIGHHFLVVQIIFHPGALTSLLGIKTSEFTNQYINAEDVFSTQLRDVNEQLHFASSYQQMIEVVEKFVETLVKKQRKKHRSFAPLFNYISQLQEVPSIDLLADQACLSTKQFERVFKEQTGVNPKFYLRIARFDRAFRFKNQFTEYDWLRIATECGYHDYQHLVRDYKLFTGLTPVAFHEVENKAPERRLGLSENYYSTTEN